MPVGVSLRALSESIIAAMRLKILRCACAPRTTRGGPGSHTSTRAVPSIVADGTNEAVAEAGGGVDVIHRITFSLEPTDMTIHRTSNPKMIRRPVMGNQYEMTVVLA